MNFSRGCRGRKGTQNPLSGSVGTYILCGLARRVFPNHGPRGVGRGVGGCRVPGPRRARTRRLGVGGPLSTREPTSRPTPGGRGPGRPLPPSHSPQVRAPPVRAPERWGRTTLQDGDPNPSYQGPPGVAPPEVAEGPRRRQRRSRSRPGAPASSPGRPPDRRPPRPPRPARRTSPPCSAPRSAALLGHHNPGRRRRGLQGLPGHRNLGGPPPGRRGGLQGRGWPTVYSDIICRSCYRRSLCLSCIRLCHRSAWVKNNQNRR